MDMETFKQSHLQARAARLLQGDRQPRLQGQSRSRRRSTSLVKGNEEGKNDVQFGGGYSEGGGFFVQSQFSTRNFLGEGENLGAQLPEGHARTNYSASRTPIPGSSTRRTPSASRSSTATRCTRLRSDTRDRGKGGIDRVRLSPASLRQPLARLRRRARQASTTRSPRRPTRTATCRSPTSPTSATRSRRSRRRTRSTRATTRTTPTRGGKAELLARVLRRTARRHDPRPQADHHSDEVLQAVEADDVQHQRRGGRILPLYEELLEHHAEPRRRTSALCVPRDGAFPRRRRVLGARLRVRHPRAEADDRRLLAAGRRLQVRRVQHRVHHQDQRSAPVRALCRRRSGVRLQREVGPHEDALFDRRGAAHFPAGVPVPAAVHLRHQPAPKTGDQFQGIQFTIGNTY